MAWYDVVHSCGHTYSHQIYGPFAGRRVEIDRLSKQDCPDCYKAWRDERNHRITNAGAAISASMDWLPKLKGTPSQNKWATDIRNRAIALLSVARLRNGDVIALNQLDNFRLMTDEERLAQANTCNVNYIVGDNTVSGKSILDIIDSVIRFRQASSWINSRSNINCHLDAIDGSLPD